MRALYFTFSLFLISLSCQVSGQEVVNSSGTNSFGSTGSVTSSVGQIFYETTTSSVGSVSTGVQKPYEITTTLGTDVTEINLSLNLKVYPNPTVNILNLTVDFKDFNKYQYDLFDGSGKLLTSKPITQSHTSIVMGAYPAAVYYLKVSKDGKSIKIFKILKADK